MGDTLTYLFLLLNVWLAVFTVLNEDYSVARSMLSVYSVIFVLSLIGHTIFR